VGGGRGFWDGGGVFLREVKREGLRKGGGVGFCGGVFGFERGGGRFFLMVGVGFVGLRRERRFFFEGFWGCLEGFGVGVFWGGRRGFGVGGRLLVVVFCMVWVLFWGGGGFLMWVGFWVLGGRLFGRYWRTQCDDGRVVGLFGGGVCGGWGGEGRGFVGGGFTRKQG